MDWNVPLARAVDSGHLPGWVVDEFNKVDFCAAESYCLDFKRDGYGDDTASMAEAVKDIASMFNSYGGFVVFGIEELEKDLRFKAVGVNGTPFDMQLLKGRVEAWLSADIPFSYHELKLSGNRVVGVLYIPKRLDARPNEFKRRGPEVKPGKYIFDAGDVAVRRGDKSTLAKETTDWQLVLGKRELDTIAGKLGFLMSEKQSGAALDHNLPSRSVICTRFIGRLDVLASLWAWLNDGFQYAKVIAGEGGRGKTSVAYEFATQVAYEAPLGISRVVWLTAKRKQFSGIENLWRDMPETHFESFRTLLGAIGLRLGYLDAELSEASEAEVQRMVRKEIGIQPTLFVLDDIDSLSLDDQRRALEFSQQAGSENVRFLLTTRSNASYSSAAAITLRGLAGDDYSELISVLSERYGVSLRDGDARVLESSTQGSPLLTDSILRVVRRGSTLRKAIDEWKGQSGEDARNAVLGSEIAQLTREAKRVLLCLAFLGQCSKAELLTASGLLDIRLGDALEELQSLFIVSAPKLIESEPRFEIGVTAALLVISKRADLAGDHVALERAIRQARAKVTQGVGQKHNQKVAIAISQALALIGAKQYDRALETIDAALKQQKNHPDLLLFKARLIVLECEDPQFKEGRELLARAYDGGVRKHILFDLWYKCERALLFGHGLIDIATKALNEFPHEESLWAWRRAEGYVLNGLVRRRNKELDQAYGELTSAAKELVFAGSKASDNDAKRLLDFLHGVHDQLLAILPETSASFRGDGVSIIREMSDRGDSRPIVLKALVSALLAKSEELQKKGGASTAEDHFEQNRQYALDLLRTAGANFSDLYKQVAETKRR